MSPDTIILNKYEAAVFLRISPYLVEWLTSHAPKKGESRKLEFKADANGQKIFLRKTLKDFDRYLAEPWPSKSDERPSIPIGISTEIKKEANYRCVICSHASGQCAHIDPVHNSKNNHPHNLIYLCPNCHDLYDKKKTIKEHEVRSIKKDILETRVSIWRSHAGLLNTVLSLIRELQLIRDKGNSSKRSIYKILQGEMLDAIRAKVTSQASSKENSALTEKIISAYKKKETIGSLISQRKDFLADSNSVDCPLCRGTGSHNNWECPVCSGVGTVDADVVNEIDLSGFEQRECPLCNGKGTHNHEECPVCSGVGTVDADVVNEIDLSGFEQRKCPLCNGKGTHNHEECPVCSGVGTVDAIYLPEIDLSDYS